MLTRLLMRSNVVTRAVKKNATAVVLLRRKRTKVSQDLQSAVPDLEPTRTMKQYHDLYSILSDIKNRGTKIGYLAEEVKVQQDVECLNYQTDPDREYFGASKAEYSELRTALEKGYKSLAFAFEVGPFWFSGDSLKVKIGDRLIDPDSSADEDKNLLKTVLKPSAFGDLATMTTKMDPEIRSAWEIPYKDIVISDQYDKVSCDEEFLSEAKAYQNEKLQDILKQIQVDFQDEKLYLEPYKLNIYKVGGHFKPHKDTPRFPNMVGSLVVAYGLPEKGGKLIIRHGEEVYEEKSYEFRSPATAFYCDREHEITPVIGSKYEPRRISLTFSICKDSKLVTKTSDAITYKRETKLIKDHKISTLVNAIKKSGLNRIGIITEFDYTQKGLSLQSLKGNDRTIFEELAKVSTFKVDLLPVILQQQYKDNRSLDVNFVTYQLTGDVYRFNADDLERMTKGDPPTEKDNIVFFKNTNGLELFKNVQTGAMYVGNEAMMDAIDNIYLNAAIVVTNLKAKAANPEQPKDPESPYGDEEGL